MHIFQENSSSCIDTYDHGVVLGQVVQLPYRRSVRNWSKVLRAADGRHQVANHIHGVADVIVFTSFGAAHFVASVLPRPIRHRRFDAGRIGSKFSDPDTLAPPVGIDGKP